MPTPSLKICDVAFGGTSLSPSGKIREGERRGDFLSYAPGDPLIGELGDPSMEEREQRDPCPSSLLSYILLDHIFRI